MPAIPTPIYNPDGAGFTGAQIAPDTVAITHRDEHGEDTPIVKAVDDGGAIYLQMANVRSKVFSRPMKRNAAGDPVILDPTGAELNGPIVSVS